MSHDAVVVGAGPNGLAAAIRMAQAGRSVLLWEANETVGGAARTREMTLPGFRHDPFSGVHPLGVGSPYFRTLPLREHGLEWVHSRAPLAHPFDDGTAAVLERSVVETANRLGADGRAWTALLGPFVEQWDELVQAVLGPLRIPRHPLLLARFGWRAIRSVQAVAGSVLGGGKAGALFAGSAAHAGIPFDRAASASYGMVLNAAAHAVGWPFPRGGAGALSEALASCFRSLGGEIVTGVPVRSLQELPSARTTLLDLTPKQVLSVAGDRMPGKYRRQLEDFKYGAGTFKMDWALSGPIPWKAEPCGQAGTVHLGGTLEELAESERKAWNGEHSDRPFVLLSQPSRFDPTRAPAGMHTAWGYCHVPNGSGTDMSDLIEAQVERFAPGFRDLIIGRVARGPAQLEAENENLVGGDVNGGAGTLDQLLLRPVLRLNPYATPVKGLYLCSASTPPGGGVHGMCGYRAAEAALAAGG